MLPGGWEWIVILVVVLLVFGVGRISKIGSELGQGIRNFREGVAREWKTRKTSLRKSIHPKRKNRVLLRTLFFDCVTCGAPEGAPFVSHAMCIKARGGRSLG